MTDTWGENDAVENSSVSGNDWGADDEVEGDGAFIRGFKKANDKLAISANLAVQDPAGAAQSVATADTYAKNNQGMPEGAELMGAWDRGDGISGGISEVAGEIGKDWGEARGLGDKFKSVGANARAMGEGIAEQTGNMVAPVAGTIAGTVAGAKIGAPVGAAIGAPFAGAGAGPGAAIGGTVGGVLGGWGGASIGTAAIEGGGMTQQALMEAGIDPQDTEAVTAYLGEHGNSILKTAGVKGAIIGAVDTATMRLGGKMLNAPARAAADRAIAALGIDATDDAAVKLATKSDAFKSLIADDAAYQASKTGAGNIARNTTVAAMEPAGEFAGEYLGEGVAKDNWDTKNAALEAFSSLGQSGVMYAGQKAYQGLTKPLQAQVQPTPTPENPAPAPVPRPDPALGALSRAASLLPAAAPLPAAAGPLAEASPLLGEQVNPATGEIMQQPAPAADSIQGQDIDGDWASFSESSGTLNVPRAQMPQIKAEHRGAMVNFLNARGVTHEEQTVPATSLKPTQAEFSREKVAKAKGYEGGDRSILVSSDGHVLDGHHQWLAKREAGDDVKVIRLGAPISDLLSTVAEFPSATQAEGATAAPAEDAAPDTAIAENTTAIAVDPVADQPAADPVPAKKPAFIDKAQADHLFGTDKKREAALERIASGKAWFLSESRAQAFVKENGLADTHAVMQDNKRFVIDVKPEPDGWQPVFGFGSKGRKEILQAVVDMRRENPAMEFRTVNDGDNLAIQSRKAPAAESDKQPATQPTAAQSPKPVATPAKPQGARKIVDRERDTVAHAVMRLGGISIDNRQDSTGETKGNSGLPGIGYVWSKGGTSLDDMASKLNEHGYVPAGEMDNLGGVPWLQSVLGDHMSGRKEHFAPGSARQEAESLKQEADRQEARAAQEEADGGFDSAETIISDLLDDADLLEIRAAAAAQHAAELDEIFGDSPNETVAGTQNADRPAEEAQRPETVGSASAGEGQRPQGGQPDARAESPAEEAPSLELAQQTEAELAEADRQQKERDKTEAAKQKKLDDAKKKADNLAAIKAANTKASETFELGQNADDNLSGQGGMFDSTPSLTELGGKPANQTAVKDEKPAVESAKADDAPASQENKWFGSQNKADAYLKGKKMQATHEVVAISASRFEIREKAKSEPVAPAAKPATAAPEKPVASSNTIFTDEAADEARAFIKSMLNGSQLNSGVDPRLFQAGITLAGYHIEKGARSFAAFAKAMLADMGDGVKPYLKQWYMGVKYDPRASSLEGMSSAAMVDAFNLADIATEAASPAPAPAPATEQAQSLVDSFYALIRNDKMPKDNRELRKLVAEFDGKEADNARLKEAQEDLEAAIARYARDIAKRNMSDQATFSHLLGIYQQQPSLNVRTSSSIENQAYSTPAPLAYLAARLADIDRSTTVYEPTAGNGMLLMTADPKKATANELDEQRYNNLRALGFDAMQGDAMQVIESGALAEKSQDAIITNPPFGSVKDGAGNPTKISVDGYKIGQIDHLIAAEALKAMKDKGKATLILGANKVPGGVSTDDRIFFNWLYSHYNVTGHFELAGDLYNRQGAGWPVRVITINGRSSSANISPKQGVTQRVNTWEEVYEQYEQVLGAQLAKPAVAAGGGKPNAPTDDAAAAPQPDAGKTATPDSASRPGTRAGGAGNVSGTPAGNGGNSSSGKPGALASGNPQQRPDAAAPQPDRLEQTSAPGRPNDGGRTAEGTKPGKPAGSPVSTGENAFQAKYVPRASRKDEGVLIPVNMAQPMQDALSSLEDAVGDIDRFVMDELGYASQDELDDGLMGLQVDSVAAAIYQMKQGKGIVIADQTGIGKGRQAAAIIRWAERSGKTPVFVTMKDTLFSDMHGDLLDIGSDNITPLLMNIDSFVKTEAGGKLFANQANKHRKVLDTVAATGELPKGNNALFLTYSQINKANTQRRVLTALAPNAIFILDESHNAGGESATGEFMRELLIDAAGVTYLSATYAKRPDNMPLYFKTDIGAAISDSGNLMDAMAQGGLPLQTVVSNNLVKAGQMFRRERSYDGVSIETEVDTANRATHEAMSDAATPALRAIVKADKAFHEGYVKALKDELEAEGGALDDVAGNQASESVDHTEFSSVVHNFIRQMLLGIKADTAADRAIEALKRGEKPLIALENTMGSFLNEYAETNGIKTGDSLGEFDYRTVLSRALERSRAVKKKDAMGNEEIVQIPLGELDFITRAAYDDAQQLIDELKIDIPVSPLDWIRHRIEQAGYSVAEITGRNRTVDYSKARPVLSTLPSAEQTDKVGTTQRFNSGTLDAIILNVSGSTGISLHASEKFKDQRKRLMIVAQPAQDINVFMQMLGRVHRTGQVQVPAYLILNADLPAEKRPTALLNGKMQSLNANTSSNTESATSIKSQDMLNKYGDQVIGAYLQDNIELAIALGINPGSDGDAADGLARKVTGRMALMPVADQQTFYAEIEEQYSSLIDYLNDSNQNELLPRTFDFEAEITKEATLVESTDEKTPFGQEAVYGEYKIKAQGKQMTPAEIRAEMDKNLGGVDGAAHAKALIAGLKQLWADNINQERRENGLGDTFDRAKYHAWLNKRVTDPAYAQTLVDQAQQSYDAGIPVAQLTPESMSTQPDQLRLITEHRIGSTWRIDINGDLYNAVVVNVRSSHKKSGNPFSASKLQIQLAVNGPLRTITVPGSQWSKIEVAPLYGLSIDNAFRDQVEGSQTAKIVTGNLLAAYGEIKDAKGTIISFTKKDGSIEQGILLPKKFDFKQNTRGDFQFRSAKDAMTFLERSNDPMTARFGIASRDAAVRVRPAHGGIVVIVPKSKARGGKYFLDKNLLSITGDFVSDGNFMQALVRGPNQAKAIEWLMRKAPLYAMPSQADDARSVLGLPPAQAMPSQEQTKPSYRLTDTDTKGIPLFSARAIAKKVMAATGLNATVVNAEADLPADLQAQIRRDKATGRVAGIYHNGTAYLVASNLRDTQHAISVMLHEAIGHGGVQSVLGDKLGAVMREIYRDMPKAMRAELERRYAGQMAGMSEAEAQSMIAEEYVAHLAETDPQHSVINRLVALLRKFIRATFGDAAALKWSRNDLVQLLAEARAAVRNNDRGPKGSSRYRETNAAMALAELPDVSEADESAFVASLKGDAATRSFANAMYKARGTESPFFKAWFGKSRMVDKQGQPIAFVHRSYGERDTFTDADLGKNTGTPTAALGHFLARKDVGNVERYGPVVEQFYIRMAKPRVVTQAQFEAMGDWSLTQVKAYRETLIGQGFDGMYVQGLAWPIVFEGKNIKAVRNAGTFDATASTRYSLAQTATAAFKRWFGDSKVVGADGKPLVVYHGTDAEFDIFKPSKTGTYGPGVYFADGQSDAAESYGSNVIDAYLSIKNPWVVDADPESEAAYREDHDHPSIDAVLELPNGRDMLDNAKRKGSEHFGPELKAELKALGYDGVIATYPDGSKEFVVFDPAQIKSATGNNGDFDGSNPNIRYSLTGARDLFDRATGPTPLDNNDPFAEENRRLREGDKTLWQKAKKVFARQFAPGGLLPEAVFNEKITRDSEFQAVEFDVRHLSGGLNKAVNADYGVDVDNLTAEQMKPLAEALTGKVDPAIPEATRVAIVAMRQYIDSLSGEYLEIIQGQIDALQEKAATYGPALKAANDARKALNAAIASDSDPAIMQALAGKKAALAAQVKAKKAMDGLKGEERAQAKAAYEVAVKAHDQAKAALRASLSPELKAQAKAAEALRSEANAARSSSAEAKAESALHDKISANLGAYVNRSYQAFDDPKWFKTVPTEVVNTARAYLASGYMEQGETAAEARRLADVTVNEMLKNGTAYDSMGAFIAEGKLGAKDLTVLIKRKEIAPEIRALLGEYMDPRLNFAKSATKMGRLVWNQRFLDRVLSFGMGTILFEGKNRPADATTQIAGEKSETYAPLNGLWTYPEVAKAFQDALGKEQMSDLYRTVVRLNGMVKYGKTILSPTTAMRNWQSAMFFSLANGHFDLTQMKKSWAALREQVTQNATGDDLTYLRKLKKLGVVYDTPYAGEMMALLQDARMDELLSSKSGTGLKWLRKANQFAQGFYSFGDDFWKIIGFENEKAGLLKAGIPLAEAEAMAAKRIRDTYPTYSMIGKAIQWLRRFPLVGTFVSFPSEIIRTSVNMLQLTAADLKSDNPGLRAIGRKRAAGIAMVSGGFYALAALTAAAAGVGDDEEEALRDLAAPWSKNSTFLYTGRDADGKLRYFDLSFLDPYGYWKRPLTAMMRDQPWEKAAASGLSDMLSPFFGADITAGAIFEVMANKKPTGGPVYNEDAGSVDQLQDITNHMRKALQPGFVSNAERLYLAGTESRREGSGQPYDMRDEMVSLLGWRASTLDTQTGLYYRSFDFTDALSNARKTLTRTLRSSNPVTDGEVRESKQAANAQYQQAFTEMGRLVSAAQAAGMTRAEVVQTLKTSGIAQANIMALVNGRVPPMQISLAAQAKAVKQARTMRDSEHAAEIARRFRLAREQ